MSATEKETTAPAAHHIAGLATTQDVERIEAPVTWKAYLICAFASFGGIFFGYDSGYINGVLGSQIFKDAVEYVGAKNVSDPHQSLIVSILSCGTFFGALIAGDLAEIIGRKWTVIFGCVIYGFGVVIQMLTGLGVPLGPIVAGRLIAGVGVGFESAIVILYMSEICPRKVRGALVAGYQFCITIGIMLASCVVYATQDRTDTGNYRIPIAIQFAWALILGIGLLFLPDSPRYYVKKGNLEAATASLSRLRGQPRDSEYIQVELAEIVANEEYERQLIPNTTWFGSWANCFKGSVFKSNSNLRKTILGTSMQMMQQWTGVNFIFYYSTPFLQSTGAISNTFLISMVFTIINVCSTPISFWTVERFGRRTILFWGALGMLICQFLVAIIGVTVGFNHTHTSPTDSTQSLADNISAVNAQIAFIAIFIFFFASTWGPGAWIVIGEIFPLPIRSRGVGLSTASNWLWNTIIAVITPYMVGESHGKVNKRQKGGGAIAFIASAENDEFGETAEAEVGAVENGSPSDSSDGEDVPAGEIEIEQVKPSGEKKKSKDSRSMKLFKSSVANFVKELLKPSWRQGNMSKEVFKTIVKKTVDKVSGAMKSHQIPKSKAKIDHYIDSSQRKLTKLVMGYVDKYVKV